MRRGTPNVVFAPADPAGLLAAAAVLRLAGRAEEVQFISDREVARKIFGVSVEKASRAVWLIDLVPSDSIEDLFLPALRNLSSRSAPVRWFGGRTLPQPVWEGTAGLIETNHEPQTPAWRVVCGRYGDREFERFAMAVESGESPWSSVLVALASSWEWARFDRVVRDLADMAPPSEGDVTWSSRQLELLAEAEKVVAEAAIHTVSGSTVAVAWMPHIWARVRPDRVRSRTDADFVCFPSGPGRLTLLGTPGSDLGFLLHLRGLLEAWENADQNLHTINIAGQSAELFWQGRQVPQPLRELLGEEVSRSLEGVAPAGDVVRFRPRFPVVEGPPALKNSLELKPTLRGEA